MREGRERLLLHSQEMKEMEETSERLRNLNGLLKKRKLENPSPEDGGHEGIVSTLGEVVTISSPSDASTSAIKMTGRERGGGGGTTRTNQGFNPNY